MTGTERRLDEIARRRAELVARSAVQRAELGMACRAWRLPLALADRGVAAWRFARAHPALLAGMGATLALASGPRRAFKWLKRGWVLWRFYRGMAATREKPD